MPLFPFPSNKGSVIPCVLCPLHPASCPMSLCLPHSVSASLPPSYSGYGSHQRVHMQQISSAVIKSPPSRSCPALATPPPCSCVARLLERSVCSGWLLFLCPHPCCGLSWAGCHPLHPTEMFFEGPQLSPYCQVQRPLSMWTSWTSQQHLRELLTPC